MNDVSPYNTNPELVAMKDDIANRKWRLNIKSGLIMGAFAVAGIAAGILLFPLIFPAAAGATAGVGMFGNLMAGYYGAMGGGLIGAAASGLFTMKESEKLKVDEDYLKNYVQAKGNWGEGYRREVAEHGYSLSGPMFPGVLPQPARANAR